jgi:hypothetical protein
LLLCRTAPSRYFEERFPEVPTLYKVYQKSLPKPIFQLRPLWTGQNR